MSKEKLQGAERKASLLAFIFIIALTPIEEHYDALTASKFWMLWKYTFAAKRHCSFTLLCYCSFFCVFNRPESWGHTLWSNEEEVSCVQCHPPTCQPPNVSSVPSFILICPPRLVLCNVPKHFNASRDVAHIFDIVVLYLCRCPKFFMYSQVPLTAGEWPSHGVHGRSVFQAKVQSAAQVSTFTLSASRAGTEAHLPSLGGEKHTIFSLQYYFNFGFWPNSLYFRWQLLNIPNLFLLSQWLISQWMILHSRSVT